MILRRQNYIVSTFDIILNANNWIWWCYGYAARTRRWYISNDCINSRTKIQRPWYFLFQSNWKLLCWLCVYFDTYVCCCFIHGLVLFCLFFLLVCLSYRYCIDNIGRIYFCLLLCLLDYDTPLLWACLFVYFIFIQWNFSLMFVLFLFLF